MSRMNPEDLPAGIDVDDLIVYFFGEELSPEKRGIIDREKGIIGSPVREWLATGLQPIDWDDFAIDFDPDPDEDDEEAPRF